MLVLDDSDIPHIVWESRIYSKIFDYATDVYYTKWNGEDWVNDKGEVADKYRVNLNVSENSFTSSPEKFLLDSKDDPHILWFDSQVLGGGHLVYRKWDENGWVGIKGQSESAYYSDFDNSQGTSDIVMDRDDNLHVITYETIPHRQTSDYKIGYLKRADGKWTNAVGDEYSENNDFFGAVIPSSINTKIQVDSNNFPCILWTDDDYNTDANVFFIRWNGENWVNAEGVICNIGFENSRIYEHPVNIFRADFKLDDADNPHIFMSYFPERFEEYDDCLLIYYVKWDGEKWTNEKGNFKNSMKKTGH